MFVCTLGNSNNNLLQPDSTVIHSEIADDSIKSDGIIHMIKTFHFLCKIVIAKSI